MQAASRGAGLLTWLLAVPAPLLVSCVTLGGYFFSRPAFKKSSVKWKSWSLERGVVEGSTKVFTTVPGIGGCWLLLVRRDVCKRPS